MGEFDPASHGGARRPARSWRMGRSSVMAELDLSLAMRELDPGPTMGSSPPTMEEAASVTARAGWEELGPSPTI